MTDLGKDNMQSGWWSSCVLWLLSFCEDGILIFIMRMPPSIPPPKEVQETVAPVVHKNLIQKSNIWGSVKL